MTKNENILNLAREMLNAERAAVQNAEHGNEKAVIKYQSLADLKMKEIASLLESNVRMQMINGHPNGDPFNDSPSLR